MEVEVSVCVFVGDAHMPTKTLTWIQSYKQIQQYLRMMDDKDVDLFVIELHFSLFFFLLAFRSGFEGNIICHIKQTTNHQVLNKKSLSYFQQVALSLCTYISK